MDFNEVIRQLTAGFQAFTWGNGVMLAIGIVLVTLAVVKEYEPVLLLPIGAGCILANRLTASGRHRVLMLEAGGEPRIDRGEAAEGRLQRGQVVLLLGTGAGLSVAAMLLRW